MEGPQDGHAAHELLRTCQLKRRVHKRVRRQGVPDAATDAQQRERVRREQKIPGSFREYKA